MKVFIYVFLALVLTIRIFSFSYNYPEGQRIRIRGQVLNDPVVYDNVRYIKIKGLSSYINLFPEVNYGDYVVLEGEVQGNKLKKAQIIEVSRGGGIFNLREKILGLIKSALPEPHSSLVGGIVLGSKAGMPEDFWEALKATGTAHVVVASGTNVSFVISFIVNLLCEIINRRKAIVLGIVGAWVYVVLSGFEAPLARAAIMGSIAFGAQAMGRITSSIQALLLSAWVMLILKPEWINDIGFALSFIATLSLILFESKVSRLLSKIPLILRKDFSTSVAAQIGVGPLIFFTFGSFNILSPFINALVLWTIPPIMVLGAAASILGLIFTGAGKTILYLVYPFTWWFKNIIELFSRY